MDNLEIDITKTDDFCKKIKIRRKGFYLKHKRFLNEEGYLIIPPTDFIKKKS